MKFTTKNTSTFLLQEILQGGTAEDMSFLDTDDQIPCRRRVSSSIRSSSSSSASSKLYSSSSSISRSTDDMLSRYVDVYRLLLKVNRRFNVAKFFRSFSVILCYVLQSQNSPNKKPLCVYCVDSSGILTFFEKYYFIRTRSN